MSLSLFIGILGQVWYLIVSNSDLCTLSYFATCKTSICSLVSTVSPKTNIRHQSTVFGQGYTGLDKPMLNFHHKIINIFLPIILAYVLSTHSLCFGREIRNLVF